MNPATIIAQIPDAIIFADREGIIRPWNPGAGSLFGYSIGEAFGQGLDLIIRGTLPRGHWKAFHEALVARRTKYGRKVLTTRSAHKSGKKLYGDLSFAIATCAEGRVAGSVALARDATERYTETAFLRQRIGELEARAKP